MKTEYCRVLYKEKSCKPNQEAFKKIVWTFDEILRSG